MTVLTVLMLYLDLTVKQGVSVKMFEDDKAKLQKLWYSYNRIPLFLSVLFLLIGFFYVVCEYRVLLLIKTPSYCSNIETHSVDESCVYSWQQLIAELVFYGFPPLLMLCIGASTRSHYRLLRKTRSAP
jgi:hypothetical protein